MNADHSASEWASRLIVATCFVAWVITAIRPHDPQAWLLEQIAALLCIGLLLWANRRVRLSLSAKASLGVLFVAHVIGTHYTYSLTPYDAFCTDWLGFSPNQLFGWERNHYDRFVHLLYGICVMAPSAEVWQAVLKCSPRSAWFVSWHWVISTSAIYELMEWSAALVVAREAGINYLGTQGDVWDAQADIALAGLGAAMVWIVAEGITRVRVSSDTQHRFPQAPEDNRRVCSPE